MAPVTLAMEYCTVELQMLLIGPLRFPGWAGMLLPTDLHRCTLAPQALVAVTHTFPPGAG